MRLGSVAPIGCQSFSWGKRFVNVVPVRAIHRRVRPRVSVRSGSSVSEKYVHLKIDVLRPMLRRRLSRTFSINLRLLRDDVRPVVCVALLCTVKCLYRYKFRKQDARVLLTYTLTLRENHGLVF